MVFRKVRPQNRRVAKPKFPTPKELLLATIECLGKDEIRVLHEIAQRLLEGQAEHGKFDIKKDLRDWEQEMHEELLDATVYGTLATLKKSI